MNVLLLYPRYPESFWSFTHALRFISKKAAVPPLGLITVSAMLPSGWNKKLVDLNITTLQTSDLQWADYVFISAMYIQKESVNEIIQKCKTQKVKIVAGGPLFTQEFKNYPEIDHFILNEAEITIKPFLKALEEGIVPEKVYQTEEYADLSTSPVPDYQLLNRNAYASMNIQFSRGCPFSCDFCEITTLLGHKVRMKNSSQIIDEMDHLYQLNWRGSVSIVDDNFIGNKKEIKTILLPAMKAWQQKHHYPFIFNMQSSINLADDVELMTLMIDTGFRSTFIGIETPSLLSLQDCHKLQNKNRDLLQSVSKIQQAGFQVSGGFIVGFDTDSPAIFQQQIDFIQESGIVTAMVGLLNAPKNTKLYNRLQLENRLTVEATGSNTDMSMNFIPKMNQEDLLEGYKKIIESIYTSKPYYKRTRQFLLNYNKQPVTQKKLKFSYLLGFFRSVMVIGIINKGRGEYWKFLIWTLINRPALFMDAIVFAVYGYHFRTVYGLRDKRL